MKKTIVLVLLIALVVGGILLLKESFYKNNEKQINNETGYIDESTTGVESPALKDACLFNGGNWLDDFSQCENVDKEWCEFNGGTFSECGSACRNNPEAEICTLQCVQFCQFVK